MLGILKKFYVCFDCKDMIPCIPGNYINTIRLKEFLIKHSNHRIALLTKKQLKEFSNKRFREFKNKIQTGEITILQN